MSEGEVRKARMEVEKNAGELEHALDHLREQLEGGIDAARELGAKVKETSALPKELAKDLVHDFVDQTVEYARDSAQRLLGDVRESVEQELRKMDRHPVIPWATLFVAGLALGFLLSRAPGTAVHDTEEQDRQLAS